MAISKIKPRHASEGRSIAAVLKDRLDYDKNPEKTKGGLLVSSYQCSADTAWQEFTVSKQIYEATTGRRRDPDEDVISYLLIQSFRPGEITPEEANRLGYQLALEFTGGQHQFIVATHIDKHHIHCHIEFNSTTLDCTHKFNNYWNTYKTIRQINDRLCQEHKLSVIKEPKEKGKHYAEWANEKRGSSWKAKLRRTIDRVLPTVSSYEEFLAANPKRGMRRVQAFAGNRSVPVENVRVAVSKQFTDGLHEFYVVYTNQSGIADDMILPAPDRQLSQQPGDCCPYADYQVTTSKNGFQTMVYMDVPVYDGIKSIQPARMIPEM